MPITLDYDVDPDEVIYEEEDYGRSLDEPRPAWAIERHPRRDRYADDRSHEYGDPLLDDPEKMDGWDWI